MSSIIKVDTIQNAAGTTGLTIDSNGVVSKGVVPSWRVSRSTTQTVSSATVVEVTWDTYSDGNGYLDGGCTLSSGIITVPVAGLYLITSSLRIDAIGSGYIIGRIEINDQTGGREDTYVIDGGPNSSYDNLILSDIFKLSANDNVRITVGASTDTSWEIDINSTFSGSLIG